MKNVVFWIGVKSQDPALIELKDYGGVNSAFVIFWKECCPQNSTLSRKNIPKYILK